MGVVAGEESRGVDAYKPAATGETLSDNYTHKHNLHLEDTQYFCVFPERGDVAEIGGGSTEANSAHPQGLSCHCPAERGTGVPQ